MKHSKTESLSQVSRSSRQLNRVLSTSKTLEQKHQHTASMPGFLNRKTVSKSPIKLKSPEDTLSKTIYREAATPPSHVRKRSLSATRHPEPLTPPPLDIIMENTIGCPNCERLKQKERAVLAVLSQVQYQMRVCIDSVEMWRAGKSVGIELTDLGQDREDQFQDEELGRAVAGIYKELAEIQGAISELSRDVELLSRHATWENVAIVKRKEGSSKEGILQKVKEAKSLLSAVKSAYTSAKASTPQLSSTDPLQVRSLKLQLQETVREKLFCELQLKATGRESTEAVNALLRDIVQEAQVN